MDGVLARPLGIALALAGALGASACDFRSGESYRYRITVEVDTPQGLRTGSSVWETSAKEGSGLPDTARRVKNRGEAVAVDLPSGTLFSLLRDERYGVDYPHYVVRRHLEDHPDASIPMSGDWNKNMAAIRQGKPAFELYPDEYPILVRFRDPRDPATVEKVQPSDFPTAFGPGVRLRRITVAVTDDPVSSAGIRQRLGWLSSDQNSDKRMKTAFQADDWSFPAVVRHGDFVRK